MLSKKDKIPSQLTRSFGRFLWEVAVAEMNLKKKRSHDKLTEVKYNIAFFTCDFVKKNGGHSCRRKKTECMRVDSKTLFSKWGSVNTCLQRVGWEQNDIFVFVCCGHNLHNIHVSVVHCYLISMSANFLVCLFQSHYPIRG